MSDIVIKNGKLPPNCWDCKYESYHVPDCPCWNGTADASDYRQSRYPFCPIKELPEHGDLIDRQAVVKQLSKAWNVDDDDEFANESVWRIIEKEAPTVLEASK